MNEAPEVAAARRLAARVAPRADEIERGRRLPLDLAREFAGEGLFSLCVPARYGGRERSARDLVRAIEEVSVADGSAGWCVMIGATTGLLAASLPEEWAQKIYGADPTVITGGVVAAGGRARAVAGGHVVSGRWGFASGIEHSDWIVGGTAMSEGEQAPPAGAAEARLLFFERSQLEVLDTWNTLGLRGTGSHDFQVDEAFVPEGRSVLLGGHPRVEGPLYAFPTLGLLALGVCAVALGIARRALDEFVELAAHKTPAFSSRSLANRPSAQRALGEAEAALGSARAFVFEAIDEAWQSALSGDPLPPGPRAALRLAAADGARRAASAVDLVHHAAGGTSVYRSSPLERCFRDVHTALQHGMVQEPMYDLVGQVLLGVHEAKGRL